MAMARGNHKEETVAVAIDKDKGSHHALKFTVDRLLNRGQTLTLIHVKQKPFSFSSSNSVTNMSIVSDASYEDASMAYKQQLDNQARDFFLPFRCLCTRKDIQCNEVVLDETDIAKALLNYVNKNWIDILVLGAPSKSGIVRRFKFSDVPSSVSKGAPEFCTVYVIAKGKISSCRQSTSPPPPKPASINPPPRNQLQLQHPPTSTTGLPSPRNQNQPPVHHHPTFNSLPSSLNNHNHKLQHQSTNVSDSPPDSNRMRSIPSKHHIEHIVPPPRATLEDVEIKSPFTRPGIRASMNKGGEPSTPDSDISFVSRGRPSIDRIFPPPPVWSNSGDSFRPSNFSDNDTFGSFSPVRGINKPGDNSSLNGFSSSSQESDSLSWSSNTHVQDDVEAEMRRLKLELKQTMDMYSTACKEALVAKQRANELHRWKQEEEQRLEEARSAEEAALALVLKEREKCKAAMQAAEAAQRIAELEARKRVSVEKMADMEAEDANAAIASFGHVDVRYRRYTIEEIQKATEDFSESLKIGEGGYGPVYRGELDHTQVAIKVLRPDAAQGRSQFQQEVEVLSCIRHPNMVLLLGACPEFGSLVYEYMANGSLEDCLFRRGDAPVLPWQLRFRIAAEIATGLLFLHQAKPEPIVHRDLKPGNILLDRNYVSKISDVGLARLVPPSVANAVTQYRMTVTAGTFCYIDPEYQQTGLLGIKSDIYSLGIMLLQIITSRSPMGLTHAVERSIERGTFAEMLDPEVPDWPVEEAQKFAELSLQCAEMRKRDRPDLGKVVLPVLNRLRAMAEESMGNSFPMCMGLSGGSASSSSYPSQVSSSQEITSPPQVHSGSWSGSSRSPSSSTSSFSGRRPYWMD